MFVEEQAFDVDVDFSVLEFLVSEEVFDVVGDLSVVPEVQCARRIQQRIESSQEKIDAIWWATAVQTIGKYFFQTFFEALNRGVKIRLISRHRGKNEDFSKNSQSFINHPNFELRHIFDQLDSLVDIIDGKEAIIPLLKDKYLKHPESQGSWKDCPILITNHPQLVAIVQESFDSLWTRALE